MTTFSPLPLGQRIPESTHGVSCSLPTMRSVIGYEEKDPEITRYLTSGYPRFVYHPYLKQTGEVIARRLNFVGRSVWLTTSSQMARLLQGYLAPAQVDLISHEGISGVTFVESVELNAKAKAFLQHTGGFLSSRAAEDFLLRAGRLATPQAESVFKGNSQTHIVDVLTRAYGHGVASSDIFLAPNGMNAIYATFRAIDAIQRPQGRTKWLQLGWLYLDTIAILQKFAGGNGNYLHLSDIFDLPALERLFAEHGASLAGVITEVPTNPLVQTPDLAVVQMLARKYGVPLVLDPTLASPLNIDILSYADIVVNSLTKYTASEGDVILGAAIVNPNTPNAAALRAGVSREVEPVYSRDVDRLAAQIGNYDSVITQINRSSPAVVDFLCSHPSVKEVFWSLHPKSRENYLRIARHPDAIGSVVSFSLNMPIAQFYDRLRLPKGPSFGMKSTLICPFIYLAHFDLVMSEEGRKKLKANGLDPELLRLSIGCEPAEEIIAALSEALAP